MTPSEQARLLALIEKLEREHDGLFVWNLSFVGYPSAFDGALLGVDAIFWSNMTPEGRRITLVAALSGYDSRDEWVVEQAQKLLVQETTLAQVPLSARQRVEAASIGKNTYSNLSVMASDWLSKLSSGVAPGGKALHAKLVKAKATPNQIGTLLDGLYQGHLQYVNRELVRWGLNGDDITTFNGLARQLGTGDATGTYLSGLSQDALFDDIWDGVRLEFETRMMEEHNLAKREDVQKNTTLMAQELQLKHFVAAVLFGRTSDPGVLEGLGDSEKQWLASWSRSPVVDAWYRVQVKRGAATDGMPALTDVDIATVTALVGDLGDIAIGDDAAILRKKQEMEDLVRWRKLYVSGKMGAGAYNEMTAGVSDGAKKIIEAAYATPVEKSTDDGDTKASVDVRQAMVDALMGSLTLQYPTLDPLLLQEQAEQRVDNFLEPLLSQSSYDPTSQTYDYGNVDSIPFQSLVRSNEMEEELAAYEWQRTDGEATISRNGFYRRLMEAAEIAGITDVTVLADLQGRVGTLYADYQADNLSAGSWRSFTNAIDPATWIAQYVDYYGSPTEEELKRYERNSAVQAEGRAKLVAQATNAYERTVAQSASPLALMLFDVGVPLDQINARASEIFSYTDGETASSYWKRVDNQLRLLARKASTSASITAPFVDTYGLLKDSTDVRAWIEDNAPQAIPDEVGAAEQLGLTMGQVASRRAAFDRKAQFTVTEATAKLANVESRTFLDEVTPYLLQLPPSQRNQAVEAALLGEEELRAEFKKQQEVERAEWEAGEPARQEQSRNIENAIARMVGEQFGTTGEEATRAATAAQSFEMFKMAQSFGVRPAPVMTPTFGVQLSFAPTEAQIAAFKTSIEQEVSPEELAGLDTEIAEAQNALAAASSKADSSEELDKLRKYLATLTTYRASNEAGLPPEELADTDAEIARIRGAITAAEEADSSQEIDRLNKSLATLQDKRAKATTPRRQMTPADIAAMTEENYQAQLKAAGGQRILDISQAFRSTRATAPATPSFQPLTWERFLKKQPFGRFTTAPVTSPQLATRRVR